ncbi:hypothetical protein [Flavobacterium sp. ASW18X]|uniref:hypothetical protein n=1 Tax=Flavobacterium sp. ASW18X TaxID=2572595 RepID=UPI0010AE52E0|nr:hypothetical protein [Flavobacterium sp. ASW18X]
MELMVRAFHLHTDMPDRYINEAGVELNAPHQEGLFVTGNRRQHAVPYKTDAYGFNTLQNNRDTKAQKTIALIGDSFIEGFHQPTSASLGKMVEAQLQNTTVTEYGLSGYDFADQLYLVHTYREHFEQMDALVFYLKYENDLERDTYTPNWERNNKRGALLTKIREESKLLSYVGRLGIINEFSRFIKGKESRKVAFEKQNESHLNPKLDKKRITNFKKLLQQYSLPLSKIYLLVDASNASTNFIRTCKTMGIKLIDINSTLQQTDTQTNYLYDTHWNHYGRQRVATAISSCFKK